MKRFAVRLVALAAMSGLVAGGLGQAAWAEDHKPRPAACSFSEADDLPLCMGDDIANPDDEQSGDDQGRGSSEQGCFDEYGYWDGDCTVVIDDSMGDDSYPNVGEEPSDNCTVAFVTADDGTESKLMTCVDGDGNLLYTVSYDAAGCRVYTDAEGNSKTECPQDSYPNGGEEPSDNCTVAVVTADDGTESKLMTCVDGDGNLLYTFSYDAAGCRVFTDAEGNSTVECPDLVMHPSDPVCEVTTNILDDGSEATTTICSDDKGNVLYKSYKANGCTTWSDFGGTVTECYTADGHYCVSDGSGGMVCEEAIKIAEHLVLYTTGTRGADNCTVCRGGSKDSKSAVKGHVKKSVKKPAKKPAVKAKHTRVNADPATPSKKVANAGAVKKVNAAKKTDAKVASKKSTPAKKATKAKKAATKTKKSGKSAAKKTSKR